MKTGTSSFIRNGDTVALAEIPSLSLADFREQILQASENGARIAALFGQPVGADSVRLFAVLANDAEGQLTLCSTEVADSYPVADARLPAGALVRARNCRAMGRPARRPSVAETDPLSSFLSRRPRCLESFRRSADRTRRDGFLHDDGEEIHEVAVGPVHAGIIEPGHFRFQCHGEKVFHLEISLGYQHRGVERALVGGPDKRTIPYMETLAGDTTIGHTLAYCEAVEALAGCRVPARAQALRAIALELERLANHTGDLGALAGDIGYLPTASYCGRIRGDFLNMTALICGNRFGRGLVRPGGVLFDLDEARQAQLEERLEQARKDVTNAVNLLWDAPSVRSRFENAGPVSRETALELGLVGLAARASGIERDVRAQFPSGIYRFAQIPVSSYHTGNVFARAYVRWMEIQRSIAFILDQLNGAAGRARCARKSARSRRTTPWCRWPKAGAARFATWR